MNDLKEWVIADNLNDQHKLMFTMSHAAASDQLPPQQTWFLKGYETEEISVQVIPDSGNF